MQKILITGSNGQLAWDIKKLAQIAGIDFFAPQESDLDITSAENIKRNFDLYRPTIVINAAAYTKVDLAETEIEKAFLVNKTGPENLARFCEEYKIPLVHVSTDYVFAGDSKSPYLERDKPNPQNVYGKSKLAGEIAVQENCKNYLILRVSGVFGFYGHNFVKTILNLANQKETLKIVADQIICPTPSHDIAEAILKIANADFSKRENNGIFHYVAAKPTSWYEFASVIIKEAEKYSALKVKNILPVTTKDFPTPAKRPIFSVLSCEKIKNTFGVEPKSWEPGLAKLIKDLNDED